ncbi:MAG: hypothetical protein INQ03_25635 [Candidatus Heimdallarchaeota archaeon]|nr:hypothetical protein [Candidatus Heimdallarchaeota archaeon]
MKAFILIISILLIQPSITSDSEPYIWIWDELEDAPGEVPGDDVLVWGDSLGSYYNSSETRQRMQNLAQYSNLVTYFTYGKSVLGSDLSGIRISAGISLYPKYDTLIVGAIHARELITIMDSLIFAESVVYGFENEETWAVNMLNHAEIYVIPVINPDGVDSMYLNPWQRKNLRGGTQYLSEISDLNGDNQIDYVYNSTLDLVHLEGIDLNNDSSIGVSTGVDLNRNFPFQWGFDNYGSTDDEEDATYRGPYQASEPEVYHLIKWLDKHRFYTAISLHSGIEAIITPWGYSDDPTADNEIFEQMVDEMQAITNWPTWQEVGGYDVNGVWEDYMYNSRKTLAFTLETYGANAAAIFDMFNPSADQVLSRSTTYTQPLIKYITQFPSTASSSIKIAELHSSISVKTLLVNYNLELENEGMIVLEQFDEQEQIWHNVNLKHLPEGQHSGSIDGVYNSSSDYRLFIGDHGRGYYYLIDPDNPIYISNQITTDTSSQVTNLTDTVSTTITTTDINLQTITQTDIITTSIIVDTIAPLSFPLFLFITVIASRKKRAQK